MVRITEEEITDIDGQVRKVRKIEAARARIERPDGTVEEYSGATVSRAEENCTTWAAESRTIGMVPDGPGWGGAPRIDDGPALASVGR